MCIYYGVRIEGDFCGASGWLIWFKKQHGIWRLQFREEKLSVDWPGSDAFNEDFITSIELAVCRSH